jgi:hypothetical protein
MALARMDIKLVSTRVEFVTLNTETNSLTLDGDNTMIRKKWGIISTEWSSVQLDAEVISDELREDKWIAVFRTVATQAKDMMESLERVLLQSSRFVAEVGQRGSQPSTIKKFKSNLAYLEDCELLRSSLIAKIKYYSPACERVLKILGKGIAGRRTSNGEVLRTFSEMNARWTLLLGKMESVELEMGQTLILLRDQSTPTSPKKSTSTTTLPAPPVTTAHPPNKNTKRLSTIPTPNTSRLAAPRLSMGSPTKQRSKSPLPPDSRPRWNISTRPIVDVLPTFTGDGLSQFRMSERYNRSSSAMGNRPSSVMGMSSTKSSFLSKSMNAHPSSSGVEGARSTSPSHSIFSDTTTTSSTHRSSSTPSSKIPAPSRRHSHIPTASHHRVQSPLPPLPSSSRDYIHHDVDESPSKSRQSRLPRRSSIIPPPTLRSPEPLRPPESRYTTTTVRSRTPETRSKRV